MGAWPKTIFIKGVGVPVDSWEELDELLERYGGDGTIIVGSGAAPRRELPLGTGGNQSLTPTDRTLLSGFVEAAERGVLASQIGQVLGKQGKAIRPALDAWSRKIGLVTGEGGSAFSSIKRWDGRGYALTGLHLQAARSVLGMQ